MNSYKVLEVKESIFKDNNARAEAFRSELSSRKILFINVMSSPGSGKTTTLCQLIQRLSSEGLKVGVLEADIDSDVDAKTIMDVTGARVIQLHTGGMCHLDCDMTRQGMEAMGTEGLDVVFLENIGNLVCPAEFDTGAHVNLVILSVPEGDDKPVKYPLMFEVADICVINKTDTLPIFDFDMKKAKERILARSRDCKIYEISALKGTGIEMLSDEIIKLTKKLN